MNVDVLENNPSWKYYLALLLPLGILILIGYWLVRDGFRRLRAPFGRFLPQGEVQTVQSQTLLDNSTVVAWAVQTGQTTVLTSAANGAQGMSTSMDPSNTQSLSLHAAIKNGHIEVARVLATSQNMNFSTKDSDGNMPLHLAVMAGSTELTRLLLDRTADPYAKNGQNETALDIAISMRNEDCASILLQTKYRGVVDVPTLYFSSLHYAAFAGDLPTFKLLANSGFSFDLRDENGLTPMFYALDRGSDEFFAEALRLCPNILTTDNRGFSLLHMACELGKGAAVDLLLEKGLPVNQMSAGNLQTPLILIRSLAPTNDHPDDVAIMRTLLRYGADLNHQDTDGNTICHFVVQGTSETSLALLKLLREEGADLHKQNKDGDTPLHIACGFGNLEAMKVLVDPPDHLGTPNNAGYTPARRAAVAGHLNIVTYIVEHHPTFMDLSAQEGEVEFWQSLLEHAIECDDFDRVRQVATATNLGLRHFKIVFPIAVLADAGNAVRCLLSLGCPIEWAAEREGYYNSTLFQRALQSNCTNVAKVLLDHNVPVDGVDESGWTALHSATSVGNVDAVKRILPRIRDVRHKDKDGWTALDIADWKDNDAIRQLLDDGTPYVPAWKRSGGLYFEGCSYSTVEGVEEPVEAPAIRSADNLRRQR